MTELLDALMSPGTGFMPHGMCYAWRADILWLNVGADALIAAAYLSIPFALLTFVHRRRDLEFRWMFELFAAFIVLCACTHIMSAWVVWNPDYALHGLVKLATALVSLATAAALWSLIPKALALPSPSQLSRANAALVDANTRLEERVAERTAELEAKQQALLRINEDLQRRDAEITRLTLTDPLTTVANRRRLDQVLHAEGERHRRHGNPFCVAYVDIDDFKTINDRYGHQAGDRLLQSVASTMSAELRSTDTVARYGGDEFVLVLPETTPEDVVELLERARARLSELSVPGTDAAVRCSVGVACVAAGDDAEAVLAQADRALYEAKRAGKDRVVLRG